jgi:hypothetical protein
MWGLESLGIPYNAAEGTITLPWWAAAAVGALVLILFILALMRTGLAGTLVFLALAGFGGWAILSWMDFERTTERRTLEARLSSLQAQASAPGSAFACLDGMGGETIEAACERDVFSSPEATAAAVSYTSARLALMSDGSNFAARRDPTFDSVLDGLRAGLEQDRFGFVAHVLALRHKCSADRCEAFRLFRDANRIRTNLRQGTFDGHLVRAMPAWNARPVARSGGTDGAPMRGAALPPGYSLPSADSIPPVSIMNTEPAAPSAASEAQGAAPPPPPRRPASQARPPQPRPAAQQQGPANAAQPRPLPPPTRIQ